MAVTGVVEVVVGLALFFAFTLFIVDELFESDGLDGIGDVDVELAALDAAKSPLRRGTFLHRIGISSLMLDCVELSEP